MLKIINRNYYYLLKGYYMKKLITLFLVALLTCVLVACNNNSTTTDNSTNENKDAISIYTTVYPLQYFAQRIGGDNVNVQSIYPIGSNEHTFEPTQKDMISLADADLFFYIGLGLEGFVESAEKTLANENVTFVATAENIAEKDLDVSTGHSHDEEADEHDHGDEEHDPHVWLSPVLSEQLATEIKEALIKAQPEKEQVFTENYNALVSDLQALNTDFEKMATETSSKTFFVSHAAFGYIAGQYGLTQVPIAGLNSQSEPSQKELAEIVDLAKKDNINYIFFEQNITSNLAEVIQKEVGADTLTLHNLSVLTQEDVDNKEDYFTLMHKNMDALKKALSK